MANFSNQKHKITNPVPIVIVETKADEWLLIRSALAQCFPEVAPIWINNAAQLITYLENAAGSQAKLPGLIIMDIFLPDQEQGWALLTRLKTHPLFHYIPVIFLSHSPKSDDIVQAYNLGAASYIVKPKTYHYWLMTFSGFRTYWWKLVTLPASPWDKTATTARVTAPVIKRPDPSA